MKGKLHRLLTRLIILLPLLILSSTCASIGAKQTVPEIYPSLVWPGEPAKPRIAFQQLVRGAKDLGIEKSTFNKIVEFLLGARELHLVKPMAVVALQDGTMFIADPGAGGVHRLSVKHSTHDLLMIKGDKPLSSPVGLAVDGDRVYVSDSALGVFVIEPDTDYVKPVSLDPAPKQATGIAVNRTTRHLYVVDTEDHRVKVYNSGKLVNTIGKRGDLDGEFNYPTMVWLDADQNLYVADSLNFRIQIFSAGGSFIRQFGEIGDGAGRHSRPKGVATDRFGHIYVVDSLFHAVQIFSQNGDFLLNFGAQGSDYGEFWLPTGIFIGGNDSTTIYVADSFNKRVQVFRYVGGEG